MIPLVIVTGEEQAHDPALLEIHGDKMLGLVYHRLKSLFKQCVVVAPSVLKQKEYAKIVPEVLLDPTPNSNKVTQFLTALKLIPVKKVFLVAADMPLVSAKCVEKILEKREKGTVVPRFASGRTEPFHALYKTTPTLKTLQGCVDDEKQSFDEMLARLTGVFYFPVGEFMEDDPALETFFKVSDEVSFETAKARLNTKVYKKRVKKAEQMSSGVRLKEKTANNIYYTVPGETEEHEVRHDLRADKWFCDCKHFSMRANYCSHILAAKKKGGGLRSYGAACMRSPAPAQLHINAHEMNQNLKLPKEAREWLKEPLGELIPEAELAKADPAKLIVVGDISILTALKNKIEPKVMVFDHKAERSEISDADKLAIGEPDVKIKNPAGWITGEAFNTLKEAISKEGNTKIFVEGEEDLLALAAYFAAPEGFTILYGQPRQGNIALKVENIKKKEYAEKLIGCFVRDFVKNAGGKTVILHDRDADGCTAAVMIQKALEAEGGKVVTIPSYDPLIHENTIRDIQKEEAQNLVVLDHGGEADKKLARLAEKMRVLALDHHKLWGEKDFGQSIYLNPHIFEVPEKLCAPTSYLAYAAVGGPEWMAAAGVIADKGFEAGKDLLEEIESERKNIELAVDLLNSADSIGEPDEMMVELCAAKNLENILNSEKLKEYKKTIDAEINRLMEHCKKEGKLLSEGAILLCEIRSEHEMRGTISNQLQMNYPEKIIIIGEDVDDEFAMSLRTKNERVDLVPLINEAKEGLKDAHGGGHAQAAGCKVQLKDKEIFIKRFISAVSKSES